MEETNMNEQTNSNAYLNDMCGETSLRHLETKCCPVLTGT